jgi:hypothetical protein
MASGIFMLFFMCSFVISASYMHPGWMAPASRQKSFCQLKDNREFPANPMIWPSRSHPRWNGMARENARQTQVQTESSSPVACRTAILSLWACYSFPPNHDNGARARKGLAGAVAPSRHTWTALWQAASATDSEASSVYDSKRARRRRRAPPSEHELWTRALETHTGPMEVLLDLDNAAAALEHIEVVTVSCSCMREPCLRIPPCLMKQTT